MCCRIDLSELYLQFDQFSSSEMVGLAVDLSPHYRGMASLYRAANPGTHIGSPGRFQVNQPCLSPLVQNSI